MPRIVSANITLYSVWDGEVGISTVRLICTLSGSFLDNLSLEWFLDEKLDQSEKASTRKLQIAGGEKKTFSLSSEFRPNMTSWAEGSTFTCKTKPNGDQYNRTINICHSKYVELLTQITHLSCANS